MQRADETSQKYINQLSHIIDSRFLIVCARKTITYRTYDITAFERMSCMTFKLYQIVPDRLITFNIQA